MTRNRDLANFGDNVGVPNSVLTNTLAAEDGSSPTELVKQSAAKAWANVKSDTTTNDSFNVSSVTDNGIGRYEMNHVNNMANTTAPFFGIANANLIVGRDSGIGNVVSSYAIKIFDTNAADTDQLNFTVRHGTLA